MGPKLDLNPNLKVNHYLKLNPRLDHSPPPSLRRSGSGG